MTLIQGYALITPDGIAFSWHETREAAFQRLSYERQIFNRNLRLVMANQAKWESHD